MARRQKLPGEEDEPRKLKRDTIGTRIAKLRHQLELSQQDLASVVDRGRSTVAQWERDDSYPDFKVIELLAKKLETTPQFIAWGHTSNPVVMAPDPVTLGYVLVPEVMYGDTLEDREEVAQWGLPISWLKSEAQVPDIHGLMIFKAEYDGPGFERGDRLVVDLRSTRVSPPGVFLHWDGLGPVLSTITPIHGAGGTPTVRVAGLGETYECDASQLKVIGRVRSLWRKS